jgi:hypothetical protein
VAVLGGAYELLQAAKAVRGEHIRPMPVEGGKAIGPLQLEFVYLVTTASQGPPLPEGGQGDSVQGGWDAYPHLLWI